MSTTPHSFARHLIHGLTALGLLWCTPTVWAVYRCEGATGSSPTYSQWPCPGRSQELAVSDPRTTDQQQQAGQHHATAQKEARRFDRRMQREARQRLRERPTAIDGPVRQVSVGDAPNEPKRRLSRSERRLERRLAKDRADRTFRAVSPKEQSER